MPENIVKWKPRGKRQCHICLYYWPGEIVQTLVSNDTRYPCCAICADIIQHGLKGEQALTILRAQYRWIRSLEGSRNTQKQYWNRFLVPAHLMVPDENDNTVKRSEVKMITPLCRFSYVHVHEPAEAPSGDLKYSICILVPKEDKAGMKRLHEAVQMAVQKGVEKGTFPKTAVANLRLPFRDGDEEHESGARGPEFKGFFFFNASSKNQPGVVGPDAQPMMDPMEFYSGCWGHADVNFFPYNQKGNKGVGAGLNNVMKKRDDERLDGRMKAEDAFADYAESGRAGEPDDDIPF
jgi:hypothetical protein